MALRKSSEGDEEEYHSFSGGSGNEHVDGQEELEVEALEAPVHPVKSMQGPFEESIEESIEESAATGSTPILSAEARRQTLLESQKYDDSWKARWSQRPMAKHHPLLKLISQIVFGMHLLQQQQAKSEGEVVKILQTHVNDVDSFLERTAEDFDLAITDIEERIRHLKLPMEHKEVFEMMLDDKIFRTQLLDGNDKIESIIYRTTKAMNASIFDIERGLEANKELGKYLVGVQDRWPNDKRIIAEVLGAMRGNQQGWTKYMKDLQIKGKKLGQHLVVLATVLGEMSKLAAGAGQRDNKTLSRTQSYGSKSAPSSPGMHSKFSDANAPPVPSSSSRSSSNPKLRDAYAPPKPASPERSLSSLNKPLPSAPDTVAGAGQDPTYPNFDRPRQWSQSTLSQSTGSTTIAPGSATFAPASTAIAPAYAQVPRPRTAGGVSSKQARAADSRNNTADLTEFLKATCGLQPNPPPRRDSSHQNPLRSNPPEETRQLLDMNTGVVPPTNPTRSRSEGGIDIMAAAEMSREQTKPVFPRASFDHGVSERPSSDRISTLSGTGFARRLSKRMKHLQVPDETVPEHPEPPPDSAYASGTDNIDSDANTSQSQKPRPESVLAPLPAKFMQPLYTSRVDAAVEEQQRKVSMSRDAQSVMSLAPTAKSKHSSMVKSLFKGRWPGKKRLFSSSLRE